jgi:MraZ protein
MGNLLIGSYPARFDKSGRIKIPEKFRAAIEVEYGKELFITSLTDEAVQIYPLPVWNSLTGIAGEGAYHFKPSIRRLLIRVNSKGTKYQIDSKGRILINQALREKAKLEEEVEVIGLSNHLEIWNKAQLDEMLGEKPLTDDDFESIAELMSQERNK